MQHIGFIMDGNRRWAKKLKNITKIGHDMGSDVVEPMIEKCLEHEIPYVTFWALSRENILERNNVELEGIYQILEIKLKKFVDKFLNRSVKIDVIGDLWLLPPHIRTLVLDVMEQTKDGKKLTCIFALGYSGQDEIIRGVKRCLSEGIDPQSIDEKSFLTYLDSGRFPPVDLIVRTGGAIRHSGFYLYQSAYSEYYFTETLWPDFDDREFEKCLAYFDGVTRNFGK